MLVDSVLLALLVAMLRGGKVKNLEQAEIRGIPLIIVAFILRFIPYNFGEWLTNHRLLSAGPVLVLTAYSLLMVAMALNWRQAPFRLIAVGILLNLLVIAGNGGVMPVAETALHQAGLTPWVEALRQGNDASHVLLSGTTRFPWLADIFWLPPPYPRRQVFSAGDVLVAVGAFWLVQHILLKPRPCAKL